MATGADPQQPLLRFLAAARSAGIRISTAESLDALRALDIVGYGNREFVRDALALVIAKTAEDKGRFQDCFDRYFSRYGYAEFEGEPQARVGGASPRDARQAPLRSALGQMLFAGDRAELARTVEAAAAATRMFDIRFSTQRALYARRMLDVVGLPEFDRELAQLRSAAAAGQDGLLQWMEAARLRLIEQVNGFVAQQYTLLARGRGVQIRDEALQRIRLNNLDRGERERMKRVARAIAKRLATRYGPTRRRKLRGQLDFRRTFRRNLPHGEIPFVTVWKKRKIDKPRVMALCDVSGSVAPVAEFLLLFLYGLHEALSNLRSFAFSSHLIETSGMIGTEIADDAVAAILSKIGFGSSNYGRSLENFEDCGFAAVDKSTTVIILGDARGNGTDPRTDIMQRVFERSRRVIWLNPEPKSAWGTGDSDMYSYARFCSSVSVCNSVRHLEDVAADILKV